MQALRQGEVRQAQVAQAHARPDHAPFDAPALADSPAAAAALRPPGGRRAVAIALVGSLALNAINLAMPLFSMAVYDKVIPHGAYDTLVAMSVLGGLLVAVDWVVRVARATLLDRLADDLAASASAGSFASLLDARPDVVPASPAALSSMLRDGEEIRSGYAAAATTAVADALFAVLYLAVVFLLGGAVAFVGIVAGMLLGLAAWLAWRRQQDLRVPTSRAAALRHATLAETARAIVTLRRWSRQDHRRALWHAAGDDYAAAAAAARRNAARVATVQSTAQNLAMIAALAVGAPAAMDGTISAGALVAVVLLTARTVAAAASLAATVPRLAAARAAQLSADRIADLPREDGPHAIDLAPGPGALTIDRITLRWPDADHPVLRDLSLTLPAGRRLALAGASGCGKSSLERAVFGEVAIESGRILLDGVDLSLLRRASLRRAVVGIPQTIDILAGTLRDNIALGRQVGDDRLAAALMALGPAGRSLLATGLRLDRQIPEAGRGLSGGQVQAIAVARVLVDHHARLAILDEPTTGLDSESEDAAIAALGAWLGARTAIVISHRPDVVRRLAHEAVVLADGALQYLSSRQKV